MAKAGYQRELHVEFQAVPDRLLSQKMAQVYNRLVPSARVQAPAELNRVIDYPYEQDSSHLREGLFGSTEGRQDDRQPDGESAGVRSGA